MPHTKIRNEVRDSGLFDRSWYASTFRDVGLSGLDPLDHYVRLGLHLGRPPNGSFDLTISGLSPSWSHDHTEHPLMHIIRQHGLKFDHLYYRRKYPDVARKVRNVHQHYCASGHREGRHPNALAEALSLLDTRWYREQHNEDLGAKNSAFYHYLTDGFTRGLEPSGRFENTLRRFGRPEYGATSQDIIEFDGTPKPIDLYNPKIAVQIHLFYEHLLEELCSYAGNIPIQYQLLISIPEGKYDSSEIAARARTASRNDVNVIVREAPNRGRDIAPMLIQFREELSGSDLIFHMHSKQSPHNPSMQGWRRFLLHNLLGNEAIVSHILCAFRDTPQLGGYFAPYYAPLRNQPAWGMNEEKVRGLLSRLNLSFDAKECPNFPSGSFFWMRTDAIAPLLSGNLRLENFEEEAGQVDKTKAHAIERLLGIIPLTSGYSTSIQYVDVAYNLRNYYPRDRRALVSRDRTKDIENYRLARRAIGRAKVAIVTAVTGSFDPLKIPDVLDPDVDYICFSDKEIDGHGVFSYRPIEYQHDDKRRMARFVKTNLIRLLPEYDYIAWIDGNLFLRSSVHQWIEKLEASGLPIAAIPHPIRHSYLEEGEVAIRSKLDDADVIGKQLMKYSSIAEISDSRLIETNFMIFNARDDRALSVTDAWWREIEQLSRRDQLSINYALHSAGTDWLPILDENKSTRDADEFCMFGHGVNFDQFPNRLEDRNLEGGHITIEAPPCFSSLNTLVAGESDGYVSIEAISLPARLFEVSNLPEVSDTPQDRAVNKLANGVSVSNWLPNSWQKVSWNAEVGISKYKNAVGYGGLISKTIPGYHYNGHLVLTSKKELTEASFGVWNGERMVAGNLLKALSDDVWLSSAPAPRHTLSGKYILLGSLHPHFGHTILEGLSRLWILSYPEFSNSEFKLLVFEPSLKPYHRNFLNLFGIDPDRIVHLPSEGAMIEELYVPSPSMRSHRWISKLQADVWKRISDASFDGTPYRKVYLSRSKISERRLSNEEEVTDLFSSYGYEVVSPETLTLSDQISLAAQSFSLAGPVGSQMYLAAFQKRGAENMIIAPPNFFAKDDALIAHATGASIKTVFGSLVDNFADRDCRTWSVELDEVRSLLAAERSPKVFSAA